MKAFDKARSTVSFTENVYIVFLDALTLEQVPLKNGQPGYAIPTPKQFVKDHAMAFQASLCVIKLAFVSANLVGLPVNLPETLVSSAEGILAAVGEASDLVGDISEALGADIPIPTQEEMQTALEDPEANGEIVEKVKAAALQVTQPKVTEHRISGAMYRGILEVVLHADPYLKQLDMQVVVSADGVPAWVQKKNVEAYRAKTVLEPFDTSRWQGSAQNPTGAPSKPARSAPSVGDSDGQSNIANPMHSFPSGNSSAGSQPMPESVARQLDDITTQLQHLDAKLSNLERLAENQSKCCGVM